MTDDALFPAEEATSTARYLVRADATYADVVAARHFRI
jgi:hypothetical protein